MAEFPSDPVPSQIFIEEIIPAFFAEVDLDDAQKAIDLKVGVVLKASKAQDGADAADGDPGGAWTLHFVAGTLAISAEREDACEVTVVQSLDDWRAALWEGRPALVAEAVSELTRNGGKALRPPPGGGPVSPTQIKGFSDIQGLIEIVIADPGGDQWRLGIRIGTGPIPDEPQATILLGSEQAEAIRTGALHPLEALISGQLRLEGDLGLILQLQAVAMTASMAAGGAR